METKKCLFCEKIFVRRSTKYDWNERWLKRKYCSKKCICEYNLQQNIINKKLSHKGKNHPQWKGLEAKYVSIHRFIHRNYGRPKKCEWCGIFGLTKKGNNKVQWANISGQYLRERNDWLTLCQSCHYKQEKNVKNKRLHSRSIPLRIGK